MIPDWEHELRFIIDAADDIADPIERLAFLQQARQRIADVLTLAYERACWDARSADRQAEALVAGDMSRTAFLDYARRWNGRLARTERIRWADPFHRHRRTRILDLTKVTEGETPASISTGFRQRDPHQPDQQ